MFNGLLSGYVPARPILEPGIWRLTKRPTSEVRSETLDICVTRLPSSGILIVTDGMGMPFTWQFISEHFQVRQAIRLDRRTLEPIGGTDVRDDV